MCLCFGNKRKANEIFFLYFCLGKNQTQIKAIDTYSIEEKEMQNMISTIDVDSSWKNSVKKKHIMYRISIV